MPDRRARGPSLGARLSGALRRAAAAGAERPERTRDATLGELSGRPRPWGSPRHDMIRRLVWVGGWSQVGAWGGLGFADLLAASPPAPGTRWAAMRSAVSLNGGGAIEPYYVSIDLETARHPQSLL